MGNMVMETKFVQTRQWHSHCRFNVCFVSWWTNMSLNILDLKGFKISDRVWETWLKLQNPVEHFPGWDESDFSLTLLSVCFFFLSVSIYLRRDMGSQLDSLRNYADLQGHAWCWEERGRERERSGPNFPSLWLSEITLHSSGLVKWEEAGRKEEGHREGAREKEKR